MTTREIIMAAAGVSGGPYWIALLNSVSSNSMRGIAIDALGNVYVISDTTSQGAGSADLLIVKYNNAGAVQWQRTLGASTNDGGNAIAVDASGNVYVAGYTNSQVLIAKYDASGTIQWQITLSNFGTQNIGRGIAVDSSGNVYVVGDKSVNAGVLIAKYNTSGTIQWQRLLEGASAEYGNGIALDSSGNIYIVGKTNSQGAGGDDVLIAKYDTSGTIQWQRTLGGAYSDIGQGIAVDSSGNVYIVGYIDIQNTGFPDILIAKYNNSGTIQWQRRLGSSGDGYDYGDGIAVDISGNVYVIGGTLPQGASNYSVLIAKYDTSGTIQWQRTLGGSASYQGKGIAVDASGNLYLTGRNGGNTIIAKLPSDGSLTGSYGIFVYAQSEFPAFSTSLTAATATLTSNESTFTSATSTLTSSASTLTSTTTPV